MEKEAKYSSIALIGSVICLLGFFSYQPFADNNIIPFLLIILGFTLLFLFGMWSVILEIRNKE